ncbi:MAG: type II toxin-antitoxin system PemK/MazF family toxin [Gluconacetobacter diazotrophicus]|nr:type II toxin-antitoxin system PemK/MazF family toxin [Gluconacetobacter diazotrophicus]
MAMKLEVKRGDIVLVDLSGNRGAEKGNADNGDPRPCIVIQKDGGNKSRPVTIVVPLTDSENGRGYREHVNIMAAELGEGGKNSIADCGHIITVDGDERIKEKKGVVDNILMKRIDAGIRSSLAL